MRSRCENPGDAAYDRYGGRGIRVCTARSESFEAFARDVGEPPPGSSLDRIDNDGNYEPGNVRWAAPTQQVRNRRTTRTVEYKGETLPLAELCERFDQPYDRVKQRLRLGWTVERAVESPPDITAGWFPGR